MPSALARCHRTGHQPDHRLGHHLLRAGRPLTRHCEIHWLVATLIFGAFSAALVLAAIGQFSLTALVIFALCYGASNGLVTIAKGAYPLALFGPAHYGQTLGTLTAPSLVLNASAPLAMAYALNHWSAPTAMYLGLTFGTASLASMLWLAGRFKID